MVVSLPSEFTVFDYNNGHGTTVHTIETGSSKVIFVDGTGHFSLGSFINLSQANSAAYPNDLVTFSNDGATVTWQDGYVWTRISPTNQVMLTDYTNANGVTVHVVSNGSSQVVFSDSRGDLSIGTFINATQVTNPRYPGDMATFGTNTLTWNLDGTVWTRVTAEPPPLLITATSTPSDVSRLSLLTRVTLIGLDGPLQNVNGTRLNGKIFWETGVTWTDFDFADLNALFVMGLA